MTVPAKTTDTGPATSGELADLWRLYTEADGTSVEGAKAKEALKADFDAISKSSVEIAQIVDAYRKVYLRLSDQFKALEDFAADGRYANRVDPARRTEINAAVTAYLTRARETEKRISLRGYGNDLEELAHKQTVYFEGRQKHADLLLRRLNGLKEEPKRIDGELKNGEELRLKVEKAFTEQKYERAYFYAALLGGKLQREREIGATEWLDTDASGKGNAPVTPVKFRERLIELWRQWRLVRAEVRKDQVDYVLAHSNLDKARKQLDQLYKTGVEEAIRDLDLDPPPAAPAPPPAPGKYAGSA